MTKIQEKYENAKNKLESLCDEHELINAWETEGKNIQLIVKPSPVQAEQMSFIQDDEEKSSSDAAVKFIFEDGVLTISTIGKLFITESLMNKLKNHAKKLHYLYLQVFREEQKKFESDTAK